MEYIKGKFGIDSVIGNKPEYPTEIIHNNIRNFNNNNNSAFIFLTMPNCCRLNMNIPSISCVFIFESSLNIFSDLKELGLAARIGECEILPVFRFFILNSIENAIINLKNTQSEIFSSIMDMGSSEDKYKYDNISNNDISNLILMNKCHLNLNFEEEAFELLKEMLLASNAYLIEDSHVDLGEVKLDLSKYQEKIISPEKELIINKENIDAFLNKIFEANRKNEISFKYDHEYITYYHTDSLYHDKSSSNSTTHIIDKVGDDDDDDDEASEEKVSFLNDSKIFIRLWDKLLKKEWDMHCKRNRGLLKGPMPLNSMKPM